MERLNIMNFTSINTNKIKWTMHDTMMNKWCWLQTCAPLPPKNKKLAKVYNSYNDLIGLLL